MTGRAYFPDGQYHTGGEKRHGQDDGEHHFILHPIAKERLVHERIGDGGALVFAERIAHGRAVLVGIIVLLQRTFSEDGHGKEPALLSTKRLRKLLLVVMRNHSTGSAWPMTNNPLAKYNDPHLPDSNLKIPLWKVVRASTAAPVYFDPEVIQLGNKEFKFVDGSVTPYNNPALIAALTAMLPCYRLEWTPGPENVRIVSVGTIRFSSGLPPELDKPWLGQHITHVPLALIQGCTWQQDYLCRVLGECIFGEDLDGEIEGLVREKLPGERLFSYVRYNRSYKMEEVVEFLRSRQHFTQIDAVSAIPILRDVGRIYAEKNVKLEHLM